MYQRMYDNRAPKSMAGVPSLFPLLGLSCDSETEITVKSAASLQLTKPMPAISCLLVPSQVRITDRVLLVN